MRRHTNPNSPGAESDGMEAGDSDSLPLSSDWDLRQLIVELLGRWYWVVLGVTLGILGAIYYLSKAPKIYQATATLLLKQSAVNPVYNDSEEDFDLWSVEALNTVAEQVNRTSLMKKVALDPKVRALKNIIPREIEWMPAWSDQDNDGTVEEPTTIDDLDANELGQLIGGWMSVSVRRQTRLLDIVISHPDAKCAQVLANAIADNYVEDLGSGRDDGRGRTTAVLEKKSEEAKESLQDKESILANYEQILELLADHKEKELVFGELDRRYLPKHPKWIKAKEELDLSENRFFSEFVLIRKASADKTYWESNRSEWDQPDLDQQARILIARRLLTARATLLQSEIKTLREFYDDLLSRYRATLASQSVFEAEVESSNPAELPDTPSSPRSIFVMGAGAGFGGLIGIAIAFILLRLDTKIHTVEQLEALTSLPILATISDTPPKLLRKILADKEGGLAHSSDTERGWDPRLIFCSGLSETIYAEMYRVLRASVALLGPEDTRRVTLFSSAIPGDGKTLISTNFAIAAASQGKKTILIDFDLRKPAVHKAFGIRKSELGSGVSEVLAGRAEWRDAAVELSGLKNLTFLFSGTKAPNPGELLDEIQIETLLADLREEFDAVILDSAPLLAVSDTRLLIPAVDNFCLVTRAEHTPKVALRKVVELLIEDGTLPAGIVLNGLEQKVGFFASKKYGYGGYGLYGYGGYGLYGKGYGYGGYGTYGSDEDDD